MFFFHPVSKNIGTAQLASKKTPFLQIFSNMFISLISIQHRPLPIQISTFSEICCKVLFIYHFFCIRRDFVGNFLARLNVCIQSTLKHQSLLFSIYSFQNRKGKFATSNSSRDFICIVTFKAVHLKGRVV